MEHPSTNFDSLRQLSPYVLYDVFYDACGQCTGLLILASAKCARRGDKDASQRYEDECIAMRRERDETPADDVDAQIACIGKWSERIKELRTELKAWC